MNDGFILVLTVIACAIFFGLLGIGAGEYRIKQQAVDRGYMVQCVGKSGHHWEC